MQHVEVVRVFPAPPQQVWDVYTDHASWSTWSGLGKSSLEKAGSPDRNGAGALRALGSGVSRVLEEVVDFEPPKRMTYRLVGGPAPLKNHFGEVLFEPADGGTRVTWRCRFDSRIPGLGVPLRLFVTRIFQRALSGLARRRFPG